MLRAHDRRQRRDAVRQERRAPRDGGGITHWAAATGGEPPEWPRGLRRGQERVIAQLRAGQCPITAQYRARCDFAPCPAFPLLPSPQCACGAPVESVEHLVLECPLHELARQRMVTPKTGRSLTLLAREPERVLRFLHEIGREGCAAKKLPRAARAAAAAMTAAAIAAAAAAGGGSEAERPQPAPPAPRAPDRKNKTINHPSAGGSIHPPAAEGGGGSPPRGLGRPR